MRTWIALLPVTTLALRRRVPERHVQPLVSTHLTFEPLEHILLGADGELTLTVSEFLGSNLSSSLAKNTCYAQDTVGADCPDLILSPAARCGGVFHDRRRVSNSLRAFVAFSNSALEEGFEVCVGTNTASGTLVPGSVQRMGPVHRLPRVLLTPSSATYHIQMRMFIRPGWEMMSRLAGTNFTSHSLLTLSLRNCAGFAESSAYHISSPTLIDDAGALFCMAQTTSPDDRFAFWRREYSRLRRQQQLAAALADENEGLLRMKLCLYDDRSTPFGSVVGEAVFITDRRDAMALVALVTFVSAAMPLMGCAAYSCYDIKFKRIRTDLRKYRLRQQRDAVETELFQAIGMSAESDSASSDDDQGRQTPEHPLEIPLFS